MTTVTAEPSAPAAEEEQARLTAVEASPPLVTARTLGDRVKLRVVDHGPGIPQADRKRVFLSFYRHGDPGDRTDVGLGLVVSRGLAEAMGGTVEPEETPDGGLTMDVSLPAVPACRPPWSAAPARYGLRDDAASSWGACCLDGGPVTPSSRSTSCSSPLSGQGCGAVTACLWSTAARPSTRPSPTRRGVV